MNYSLAFRDITFLMKSFERYNENLVRSEFDESVILLLWS